MKTGRRLRHLAAAGLVAACGCRSSAPLQLPRPAAAPSTRPPVAAASTGRVVQAGAEELRPAVEELPFPVSPVIPVACEHSIDLDAALAKAGADNPTIAIAVEIVRAALARQLQARALALPSLDAGVSYDDHQGTLLSARGFVRNNSRESLYLGDGAAAVGAGSVTIPGVNLTADVAQAIYEPRVARQQVAGRRFDADAVRNSVLLEVVQRYFDLAGAEARLAATHQSRADLAKIVQLTANFVRAGQGREGDAERARSEAELLADQALRLEEQAAVAAAELSRLLSTDPAIRLHAAGDIPKLHLVDDGGNLEALVETALRNRPEIGARSADVAANTTRLRQERVRPLAPFVSVGFSAGGFGGGNGAVGPLGSRTDFDLLAVWHLDGLGFANRANTNRARAELGQSIAERQLVINQVRREVAEALALIQARDRELESARRQLVTAAEAFRLDLERTRNLVGAVTPIEVLNSANLLNAARQSFFGALAGFDQAQFQLFVALGQPPIAP